MRRFACALAVMVSAYGGFGVTARAAEPSAHLPLGGPAPTVTSEAQLRDFLDELEAQELLVYEGFNLESYYQWRGLEPHFVAPFARFANDIRNRRDYAAVIEQWRGKVTDATLARRLDLHHRDFLQSRADPAQVIALTDAQTAVQDSATAFRFHLGDSTTTQTGISEILTNEPDRAKRRAAFVALTQAGEARAASIVHCMELYDAIGKQEGFANGAEAGLAAASLTRAQVLRDLDAFEKSTRPILQAMWAQAKRDLKVDALQPWDVDYWLHVQELAGGDDAWPREPGVERMFALMRDLGFRPDSLPIDVKVLDVPVGGITFPVRPPYEARLLTNPFTGSNFYETMFHEYGHALNTVYTDKSLSPILLFGDETPMSEGVAECLGHFAYDATWLEHAAGVSPERAAQLERVGKMQLLLWLRRSICLNAYFEVSAYGNLHQNLDSLYAATYARFAGTPLPPGHYFGYRDIFATGPLYFQSYLYANMIATQFREAMRAQFGVEDLSREPRVAEWLTRYAFGPGGSVPWPEKMVQATGTPLSTEALSRYLAGAMPASAAKKK